MSYQMVYFDNLPNRVIVFLCLNISIVALAKKLKEKKNRPLRQSFFFKVEIQNHEFSHFYFPVKCM